MIARTLAQRLDLLITSLGGAEDAVGDRWSRAGEAVAKAGTRGMWLAVAVLAEEFPVRSTVVRWTRALRANPPGRVLRNIAFRRPAMARRLRGRSIEVIPNGVVVDVHHTARTRLATGIQRVVRTTITEWEGEHDQVLVGWDTAYRGLRRLTAHERQNALEGTRPHARHPRHVPMAIPWNSTYILPELALEPSRTPRMAAFAEFTGNTTVAVGHDTVPVTSAETTGAGMGGVFGRYLSAIAYFDRVATVSAAAATEFSGWRRMLAGAGLRGPEVAAIPLPTEVRLSGLAEDVVRAELASGDLPMLVCVGSHEPRKNHLAVLEAAEVLWLRGRRFCLVFVGGNAWKADLFASEVARLGAAGHPIVMVSAISDDLLAGAYRTARATVFPSLHEGFGLPVAESLAAGTPVVTTGYGSMREVAEGGGALLVDPRDDHALTEAIDQVMFDDVANQRLRTEARARTPRTWSQFARELWDYALPGDRP